MRITVAKCSVEVSQLLKMILNDHFETSIIGDLDALEESLDSLDPQILIMGHTIDNGLENQLPKNLGISMSSTTIAHVSKSDSIEVLHRLRQDPVRNNLAIIILASLSKGAEHLRAHFDEALANDRILALEAGADDYLMLPFLPRELIARLKSVHRRSQNHQRFAHRELEIDVASHRVLLAGTEVTLTLTEFNILRELIMRSGQVLSRECLRESALNNLNVTDRTIDVHMASLRKKLPTFSAHIETIRGVGYRIGGSNS